MGEFKRETLALLIIDSGDGPPDPVFGNPIKGNKVAELLGEQDVGGLTDTSSCGRGA